MKVCSDLGNNRKGIVNLLFEVLVLVFESVVLKCEFLEGSLRLIIKRDILILGLSFLLEALN